MCAFRSVHAEVCMLNARGVGCSLTSLCMAEGFLSRKCKRKTLTCRFTHENVYAKHASIRHTHSHSVWVQDHLHLKAVVKKTQKGTERGLASPVCAERCALQPLQTPACPKPSYLHGYRSPSLWLRLCPAPRAALSSPAIQRV